MFKCKQYYAIRQSADTHISQVHRRTLYDDKRGVGEPINETGQYGDGLIVRGSHVLLFDTINASTVYHRLIGESLMLKPEYMFIEDTGTPSAFMEKYYTNVRFSVVIMLRLVIKLLHQCGIQWYDYVRNLSLTEDTRCPISKLCYSANPF